MNITNFVVPSVILLIIFNSMYAKRPVFSDFTLGAADGLKTAFSIIPSLIGLLVAIKVFFASGAIDLIVSIVRTPARYLGIDAHIVPFALMRPLSGSGSLALLKELFEKYGTDSLTGRTISVMMGSTETTLYTVAVYFGAVGAKNSRHTLICALGADLLSMILSAAVCKVFY